MQLRIDDLMKIAYERGPTPKIKQLYASLAGICQAEDLQNLHSRWNEMIEFKQIEQWDLEFNDELINPTPSMGDQLRQLSSGFGQAQAKQEGSLIDHAYITNHTGAGRPHTTATTGAGK